MKIKHLPACLFFFLAACGGSSQPGEKPSADTAAILQTDAKSPSSTKADTLPNTQLDSIIVLAFAPDSNSLTVKGHLDKALSPMICHLPIARPGRLTASIEPGKKPANIRFNQVVFPDGNSDGPFGQTLEYKLPKKGMYQLIIGPSLMANDAYTGDFLLRIKVE